MTATGEQSIDQNSAQEIEPTNGSNGNGTSHAAVEALKKAIDLTQKIKNATPAELVNIARELGIESIEDLGDAVAVSGLVHVVAPEFTPSSNGHDVAPEALALEAGGDKEKEDTEVSSETDGKYSEQFELPEYRNNPDKPSLKRIAFEAIIGFFDTKQAEQEEGLFTLVKGDDSTSVTKVLVKNIEEEVRARGVEHPYAPTFRGVTVGNVLKDLEACGYLAIEKSPNERVIESLTLCQPVKKN